MPSKKYEIKIGEKYNKWTVIGKEICYINKSQKKVRKIPCMCECGRKSNIEIWKLINNSKTGCISCVKLGHIPWNKNTEGLMPTPWNKGKKLPEFTGENHPRWIKDRSKLQMYGDDNLDRRCSAYQAWRREVIKRDIKKCKIDNKDCHGKLEVHHILGWKEYPELRYDINNGITLCQFHHPHGKVQEEKLVHYLKELIKIK
jgi:hypothetical protein